MKNYGRYKNQNIVGLYFRTGPTVTTVGRREHNHYQYINNRIATALSSNNNNNEFFFLDLFHTWTFAATNVQVTVILMISTQI
jgi:hypothetical protein